MFGIPFLGTIVGLAMRFPKTAAALHTGGTVIKKNWKPIAIGAAVVIACVSAFIWLKHDEKAHYEAGFGSAQSQYSAAVIAANKIAANDQSQLNVLKQKYDDLSKARQTQVVTVTKPIIERVTREVQSDPVFSSCTVSDSVFNDLQAETAAVDASIAASER